MRPWPGPVRADPDRGRVVTDSQWTMPRSWHPSLRYQPQRGPTIEDCVSGSMLPRRCEGPHLVWWLAGRQGRRPKT